MSFDFSTLITDRTNADVSYLSALMARGIDTWTPEELEQFNAGMLKGGYWWTDLNRVTACMEYLDAELREYGYESGYVPVVVHEVPGPAYGENTLLLLHGEDLSDGSIYSVPLTNNGAQVSSAQSKFGGKSLYFNGSSYLKAESDAFNFLNSDFTVDWWEYLPEQEADGCIFSFSHDPIFLVYYGTGTEQAWIDGVYSGAVLGNQIAGEWVHRALVRSGNKLLYFTNGKNTFTGSFNGSAPYTKGYGCVLGNRIGFSQPFSGYVDEFRISNIARWTSDFTPPTEPYKVIEETKDPLDPYTWYKEDSPRIEQLQQYVDNVAAIRSALGEPQNTPDAPASIAKLTVEVANNIEKILLAVETAIQQTVKCMVRSNSFTFWSGNRPFPTAESNKGRTWAELDAMQTGWKNWQVATWYLLLYGNLKAEGDVV